MNAGERSSYSLRSAAAVDEVLGGETPTDSPGGPPAARRPWRSWTAGQARRYDRLPGRRTAEMLRGSGADGRRGGRTQRGPDAVRLDVPGRSTTPTPGSVSLLLAGSRARRIASWMGIRSVWRRCCSSGRRRSSAQSSLRALRRDRPSAHGPRGPRGPDMMAFAARMFVETGSEPLRCQRISTTRSLAHDAAHVGGGHQRRLG